MICCCAFITILQLRRRKSRQLKNGGAGNNEGNTDGQNGGFAAAESLFKDLADWYRNVKLRSSDGREIGDNADDNGHMKRASCLPFAFVNHK